MRLRLLKICLGYAYYFSIPEPVYAYKRYVIKRKHVMIKKIGHIISLRYSS